MAGKKANSSVTEMDYPAHEQNYSGFLGLLKGGIIVTALVTALVLYVISN